MFTPNCHFCPNRTSEILKFCRFQIFFQEILSVFHLHSVLNYFTSTLFLVVNYITQYYCIVSSKYVPFTCIQVYTLLHDTGLGGIHSFLRGGLRKLFRRPTTNDTPEGGLIKSIPDFTLKERGACKVCS